MTEPGGAVQYVQKVTARDGATYLYLRKRGLPRLKLASPWSEADDSPLANEVRDIVARYEAVKPIAGTMRAALRAYELDDDDFKGLADSTKREYRYILKEFDGSLGHLTVEAFTPTFINELKKLWAGRGYRAANIRLTILRNVLKPAMIAGMVEAAAFEIVGTVRRPADMAEPHPIWPLWVVETVIGAAIAEARFGLARAVAIGRFAGPRRADIARLRRSARKDGRLRFLSGKKKVAVDQLEDPALARWLAATPTAQPLSRWQASRRAAVRRVLTEPLTIVYNLDGQPYTDSGLGQALNDLVNRLAAAGRIDHARYDFHGLRHTRGVEAALSGCTDSEIAAMLGHDSAASAARYRRQADRIRLSDNAAEKIAALRERSTHELVKNEVEKGCKNPDAAPLATAVKA